MLAEVTVRGGPADQAGPRGRVLDREREQIRAVLTAHCVAEASDFGSVVRGEDRDRSDLDLTVAFRAGYSAGSRMYRRRLKEPTGLSVDVVDEERVLERARRTGIGYTVLRDIVPL